jgi:MoxR-like ATPase
LEILRRDRANHFGSDSSGHDFFITPENVLKARHAVAEQYVSEAVEKYMVALIAATRKLGELDEKMHGVLDVGASPRASIALLHSASAYAWLQGRDYVTPDDVITLLPDVLRHRLIVSFSGRAQGWSPDSIIDKLIELIPVPVVESA